MSTQELVLLLKLDRETVVEGESMLLTVSLRNNTSVTRRVEDVGPGSNSLHFRVIDKLGKELTGSIQSSSMRDGLPIPSIEKKPTFLLEPNSQKTITVDLLQIVGELSEGDYEIGSTYVSEGIWFVRSESVFLKVLKSAPVYAKTFQDSLRASSNLIRTVWINKEKDGFHLFIMEDSQFHPSNLKSNRRIMKIKEVVKAYPSILDRPEQETEHLMWIEADTPRIATLQGHVLRSVKTARLDVSGFTVLEPLFTSEGGTLNFIAKSKENGFTVLRLARYSREEKMVTSEICRFSGAFTKYCVVFDLDPRAYLAWASESGEIHCTCFGLEEPIKAVGEPRIVAKGKTPILDLQMSIAYEPYKEEPEVSLLFADHETPNELHSHLISVNSGESLSDSFFPLPERESLVLLQTVLDFECKPHYLFQDKHGALWFKAFGGGGLVKVTAEGEAYPGNVDCPVLLISSNLSGNYAVYLRYLKDQSKFVYKKLESLA